MKFWYFLPFLLILNSCISIAFGHPYWPYGVEPVPRSYEHMIPKVPVFIHHVIDPNDTCSAIYGPARKGNVFNGCTVLTPTQCDVYEPIIGVGSFTEGWVDAIETHEVRGHCNGLKHAPDGTGWYKNGVSVTS